MEFSKKLEEKVLTGYKLTKEDALELYFQPEIELYTAANSIRRKA